MAEKGHDAHSPLLQETVAGQDREHRFGEHLTPATLSTTLGVEIRLGGRVWPIAAGRVADSLDSSACIEMRLGSARVGDTLDSAASSVGTIVDAVGDIAVETIANPTAEASAAVGSVNSSISKPLFVDVENVLV